MAKKKSTKKSLGILSFIPFVLGIVAILALFLTCITVEGAEGGYSGWQASFGYSETAAFISIEILGFSLMNCIGFGLIACGVLFVLLGALGNGGKFTTLISTLTFIAGAVFMFLMPDFTVAITDSIIIIAWKLGIGAIIAGGASALAGLFSAFKLIKK